MRTRMHHCPCILSLYTCAYVCNYLCISLFVDPHTTIIKDSPFRFASGNPQQMGGETPVDADAKGPTPAHSSVSAACKQLNIYLYNVPDLNPNPNTQKNPNSHPSTPSPTPNTTLNPNPNPNPNP